MNALFQTSRKTFDEVIQSLDSSTGLNVSGGDDAKAKAEASYEHALWMIGLPGSAANQVLSAASELSRQSEHPDGEVLRFLSTVRAA